MKTYQSHKTVKAGLISEVDLFHNFMIVDGEKIPMTEKWYGKHAPQVGGYFVEYKDGYTSYSPAEPFEAGYTQTME